MQRWTGRGYRLAAACGISISIFLGPSTLQALADEGSTGALDPLEDASAGSVVEVADAEATDSQSLDAANDITVTSDASGTSVAADDSNEAVAGAAEPVTDTTVETAPVAPEESVGAGAEVSTDTAEGAVDTTGHTTEPILEAAAATTGSDETTRDITEGASDTTSTVTDMVAQTQTEASETFAGTVEAVSDTTSGVISDTTAALSSSVDTVSEETGTIADQGVSGTIEAVSDTTSGAPTVISDTTAALSSSVDTVSEEIGTIADQGVSGTVEAVYDTTSGVISDTTTALSSSVDTVSEETGTITDAASASSGTVDASLSTLEPSGTSGTSSRTTESSYTNRAADGSIQHFEGSYPDAATSTTSWLAPKQALRDGRLITPGENLGPCTGSASALCTLAADVGGEDSLADAIASIIRALAFTGADLLFWLYAMVILTIAGTLALLESRRRTPFQNLG